jgi:hypothetical protein
MLKTVIPHDIRAICGACNTSLATLSSETGISQEDLLAYAAGRLALSATEFLTIVAALAVEPYTAPPPEPLSLESFANEVRAEWRRIVACDRLFREVEDEERERERSVM